MVKKPPLKLLLLFFLPFLISITVNSHVAWRMWFWSRHHWSVRYCNGLCPEPENSPCLPFYTHFHCCKLETSKAADTCAKCKNKADYGNEYICCSDCSDPYIIDENTKLGYCRTGAELSMQPKPREHFKWIAGPWMPCSSPCDGGIQYPDVECFGQIDDISIPHYPVDDTRCSGEEMPARQETCNLRSCEVLSNKGSHASGENSGMSALSLTLLVLVGVIAIGGLAFGGYTLYQKRSSTQQGFVYIMLDGYS
ncbi:hypothetical protein ACHQM5_029535 [Ranunculus cassubicifolius]